MDTKKAIKTLECRGYKVSLFRPTTKKTFVVHIDTLNQFLKTIEQKGCSIKDAAEDALAAWIERNKK